MGHHVSLIPLPGQGCCQSHSLLFQFLLDALLTSHCHVQEHIRGASPSTLHTKLDELLGLTKGEGWLGRMGPLSKLRAYCGLYAQQDLSWKRVAVRLDRQVHQLLELAVRCHHHPQGGSTPEVVRLVARMDQVATTTLALLSHYSDDERVLLLLMRRQESVAELYGAQFFEQLLATAHGSPELGLQLVRERLKARGFETRLCAKNC
jgi:hypothetical protein